MRDNWTECLEAVNDVSLSDGNLFPYYIQTMKKVQSVCARSIFNSFTAWARYYPSSGKDKEVSERWPDWLKSVYVWRLMCLAETKENVYILAVFKLVFGNIFWFFLNLFSTILPSHRLSPPPPPHLASQHLFLLPCIIIPGGYFLELYQNP